MEEKKLADMSIDELRDALADLRKSNQQQADYAKRAWTMSLISTIAVIIVMIFILAYGAFLMPKIDALLEQAQTSIENIEQITEELATLDFEGLMDGVGGLVTSTEKDLEFTMEKIDAIDIEQLNQAIKDLSDIIQPLANFFNKFTR